MLTSPAPNPNPEIIAWARREGGFGVPRVADALEATITATLRRTTRLRQAVLHDAFSGRAR
jgi:hypothetical protein